MTDLSPSAPGLQRQRERTVELLCAGFARDDLELADFEARLDSAHRARTGAELAALVQDLKPAASTSGVPATSRDAASDALERGGRAVREAIRDSRFLLAFMGGVERRGHWKPARRNVVVAAMGGAVLDFREVELPPGETEVHVFCIMGGAEIIVPEDLAVDASGIAIMGGFEHASAPRRTLAQDSPLLRIRGVCVMGGAEIMVRRPGETERDAKLRLREQRRTQRRHRLGGE